MDKLKESKKFLKNILKERDIDAFGWNEFAQENQLCSAMKLSIYMKVDTFEEVKEILSKKKDKADQYPYFKITYKQNGKKRSQLTETDWILPAVIEIKKNDGDIEEIVDNFNQKHSVMDILEMHKEAIDIEYEDVKSVKEAYNIAFDYFKSLFNKNVLYEKDYQEHIEELKKIHKEEKELEQFIEKVKELYFK